MGRLSRSILIFASAMDLDLQRRSSSLKSNEGEVLGFGEGEAGGGAPGGTSKGHNFFPSLPSIFF